MEDREQYRVTMPAAKFYQETCTLAEHQLLKRVRQISNEGPRIILILEIISREDIRELGKVSVE